MTRMNDLKNDVSSLKDLITTLTEKMEASSAEASERSTKLEGQIKLDINELKSSLSGDMKSLRDSNVALTAEVTELRRTQEIEIKALQERTLKLEKSAEQSAETVDKLRTTVST